MSVLQLRKRRQRQDSGGESEFKVWQSDPQANLSIHLALLTGLSFVIYATNHHENCLVSEQTWGGGAVTYQYRVNLSTVT